jgi:ribosomal protein S6--L-glutamate ligase
MAAASRIPRAGRLSRTLSRNARIEPTEVTAPLKEAAEAAAKLMELEVCAVDVLEVGQGKPRIFEVNASPSLPEMEAATGVDLATAIIIRAEVMYRELHPA